MSDPNYSIPVWSSDTYFSEGDRVKVSEHSRHKPAGVEGEIVDTKMSSTGKKMYKVKSHWYPERPLRPAYSSPKRENPKREEVHPGSYGLVSGSIGVVIGILIILLITL